MWKINGFQLKSSEKSRKFIVKPKYPMGLIVCRIKIIIRKQSSFI